jgi:hypothetical protein
MIAIQGVVCEPNPKSFKICRRFRGEMETKEGRKAVGTRVCELEAFGVGECGASCSS